MFENNECMTRSGADAHEMNVFYYVAYYPYLNA